MNADGRIASLHGVVVPEAISRSRARPARGWAVLAVSSGVAAVLLSFVAHRVPYFPWDLAVTRGIQAADLRMLALPLRALNALGFAPLVDLVYGGVIVALLLGGRRWEAAVSGVAASGGAGINHVVKFLVDRPRPSAGLVEVAHHIANPSFPAGHVLNLTAFAGFLCGVLVLRARPSALRAVALAMLVGMIALMGVARIQSGEHWPSDVLGGYLFGLAWVALTVRFYRWGHDRFAATLVRVPAAAGRAALFALVLASPGTAAGTVHAQPAPEDSLATSTGVPWNPRHAMARRSGWEQAVLLPGRLLSLPLVGLGMATDRSFLALEGNPRFANVLTPPLTGQHFVRLRAPRLGDRAGLGGAVEVHRQLLHGTWRSGLSAEYAGTILQYGRTLLAWGGRPLLVQYGYEWRPQEHFYGIGNRTPIGDVSDYASQSESVRGGFTWDTNRRHDPSKGRTVLDVWGGPRSRVTRTGRETAAVSYQLLFPELAATTLDRRVENLVYGAALARDHRSGVPHWSRGWLARVSAERFDAPIGALALHTGTAEGPQFTRFQAEFAGGVSFMRSPRTLRATVRINDLDVGARADRLTLGDYSTLGGQPGLGGYAPGRFHDLDLALTRLEFVFPLQRRFEAELHSEWGAVYRDLWSDAKPNTLHESFGFSVRVGDDHAPRASMGLDFSPEGIRLHYAVGGVE
jgi:undecaprenyl-diphosphatase